MAVSVEQQESSFDVFRSWVDRETGVSLDHEPGAPLERRLNRVIERHGLRDWNDLSWSLQEDCSAALRDDVVNAVTTQETSWFRDRDLFSALKYAVLPELLSKTKPPLSIWSAGCAFGQEIYSIAMMLADLGVPPSSARLLATDIAPHAIERARAARYLGLEMARGLPVEFRANHFAQCGGEWELHDDIRSRVEFRRHDLREPIGEDFHLILCRHVLIYFDRPSKQLTLARLARSLRPGGRLVLGNAESLRYLDAPFERCSVSGVSFYRPAQRKLE